ncbi:MAG: DUF4230 domain-containing protein [Polyangiales bacterium]
MLILLIGAAALGWFAANRGWLATPAAPEREHAEQRVANTDTVLTAVRDLARLESVSFHMERVVDLKERQSRWFGFVGANDAILLVAAGDVVAGIDLSKLHDGDMEVRPDTGSVTLRLPPPEILSVALDNQRTYVHSRKTDLLAKRDVSLETQARKVAEEAIRSGALEAGILERARQTAGRTLNVLVHSLGYDKVDVQWHE